MIKMSELFEIKYLMRRSDAEILSKKILENNDYELDFDTIELVSTAFFNKVIYDIIKGKTVSDLLSVLRINKANDFIKYSLELAIKIALENEK